MTLVFGTMYLATGRLGNVSAAFEEFTLCDERSRED